MIYINALHHDRWLLLYLTKFAVAVAVTAPCAVSNADAASDAVAACCWILYTTSIAAAACCRWSLLSSLCYFCCSIDDRRLPCCTSQCWAAALPLLFADVVAIAPIYAALRYLIQNTPLWINHKFKDDREFLHRVLLQGVFQHKTQTHPKIQGSINTEVMPLGLFLMQKSCSGPFLSTAFFGVMVSSFHRNDTWNDFHSWKLLFWGGVAMFPVPGTSIHIHSCIWYKSPISQIKPISGPNP